MKGRKKEPEIRIYGLLNDLADSAAGLFFEEVVGRLKRGNDLYIALPGGKTPQIVFERLAGEPFRTEIDWSRIHFFWGDERCVPPAHPDSNYRTAAETLFKRILIPHKNIHRARGEARPDKEALRYESEIRETVPPAANGIPRFDWILLGLGTDGHTASLFPGASSLDEKERLCVTTVHPHSGRKRITFTPILINNAVRISFLVTGREKSEVVFEILTGAKTATRYPAARIEPLDGQMEWILDKAASSLLT